MPNQVQKIGQLVKATRDIPLTRNSHVAVLSSAGALVLSKGTEAVITAITATDIELNCKDGHGAGPSAWGLKIRIAKLAWWNSFE